MKKLSTIGLAALCGAIANVNAAPSNEEMWKMIQEQQAEIERLKTEQTATKAEVKEAEEKINATADAVESSGAGIPKSLEWATKTKIGGYGELHYNNFETSDDQVDAHRFVVFIGHEFQDNVRFFSEFELEHSLAGDGKPGEVELEQAYIEWDYAEGQSLVSGLFLIPVGILNETHEPETFYGVERNLVEKNIIPTTWWETGVMFRGEIAPGLSYDVAFHGGLETTDTDEETEADFVDANIRSGRQKSAEQNANDLAYTARIKYSGVPGLEVAATLQYQEDISQGLSNELGDEDASATLFESHVVYEKSLFAVRALYASWDIDGNIAATAGRDKQEGWYIEPSIKPLEDLGFFVRYSEWDNTAGLSGSEANEVIDYGVNYWLTPQVVFKLDFQDASDYNENDSMNIGVGWSF